MVYNILITCQTQQRVPKKMEQEKKIRREIANSNERRRMQSINAGFNSLKTMLPTKHDNEKLSKAAILQHTAEYIDQLEQDKTNFLQELNEIKKLLNPELLELHQKSLQETEARLRNQQPTFKRIKLDVNSLDLSNSESSDEGIQLGGNLSPKQENNQLNEQIMTNNCNLDKSAVQNDIKNGCTATLSNVTTNSQQLNQLINGNQVLLQTGKLNDVIIDSDDIDIVRAELVQVRKVLDRERKLRMKLEEQVRDLEAQLYPTRLKEIVQQIQTTGVNIYQPMQQIKDNETEMAVSSVIIEQQPVAETIEIETQNCTEFINLNANAANLLANNQQSAILTSSNFNSNFLSKSSNVTTIPSTTFHIIQDISQNNLLDSNNFVEQDKLIDGVSNQILTSTAYLTNTANTINNTIKQTKSKNLSTIKDKNVQINKLQKSNTNNSNSSKLPVTSSTTQNSNTTNSTTTRSTSTTSFKNSNLSTKNKSSVTVTALTNLSSSNQTELNKDKQKKAKLSAAAIAVPIDEPFIFDSNLEMNSTELMTNQSSLVQQPATTTVTVQIIDTNRSTSTENASNQSTNNFTGGRGNNNLDTIVEAIRHIEGSNMFGENNPDHNLSNNLLNNLSNESNNLSNDVLRDLSKDDANRQQLNKNSNNETNNDMKLYDLDQNETLREEFLKCVSRPGVIISSSNH